jgi:glucokinase
VGQNSSAIGLWLNGAYLEGALVTADGHLFAHEQVPTVSHLLIETIVTFSQKLLDIAPLYQLQPLGIGLAVNGTVQHPNGTLLQSNPYFKMLVGFPLAEQLQRDLHLPIVMDAETNMMALAECVWGYGKELQEMLYLNVGDEIHGAMWRNGAIWHGAHGGAGDIGAIVADWLGEKPLSLNQRTSSVGIIAEYGMRSRKFTKPTIQEIISHSQNSDQLAMRVLRDGARMLGTVISPFVGTFDPQAVIVNGELAHGSDIWWERFERAFRQNAVSHLREIPVQKSNLIQEAAVMGAGFAVLQQHKS